MTDDLLIFEAGEGARLRATGTSRGVDPIRLEYLCRILELDPDKLARNTTGVHFKVCLMGALALPLVINPGNVSSCYLVSSEAHYVKYCREELRKFDSWDATLFSAFIAIFGAIARLLSFNRTVFINNWLLSTSPRAELSRELVQRLTGGLVRRFGDYALVFKAVGEGDHGMREAFTSSGWQLVAHRPVHWWEPERRSGKQRRTLARDWRSLEASGLRIETAAPTEIAGHVARFAELYRALYIDKHSSLNPWYTSEFFQIVIGCGLCQAAHVLQGETSVGFQTTFVDGDVVVLSVVGFDPKLDRRRYPVYRGLMAHGMRLGLSSRRKVFLSTGAASFKLNRGSYESIEHEAIHVAHLPVHRRLPWNIATLAYNSAAQALDTTRL